MANVPADRLLTAEDLMAIPDDGWKYELAHGRLVRMAPASWVPGVVGTRVSHQIDSFLDEHPIGFTSAADTGFLLRRDPDVVRAPDIGFVRAERVSATDLPPRFFPGPPDLAIEVLSPTDRMPDVLHKIADYLDAGTRLVWFLDPQRRTAMVFRADGSITVLGANDQIDGEDVLPGFRLRLAALWL